MKKFLITASAIVFAVLATIISLACVPKAYHLNYGKATAIQVFAKYGVAKKHAGEDTFESSSQVYKELMKLLDKAMKNSLLTLLVNNADRNPVVEQDLSGMSPTFSGTTRETNYCIEMQFEADESGKYPNQIVYYQGNTKQVATNGFCDLVFVLGKEKGFGKINIYYTTTPRGSYQTSPMQITIDNSKLIDYIEKM